MREVRAATLSDGCVWSLGDVGGGCDDGIYTHPTTSRTRRVSPNITPLHPTTTAVLLSTEEEMFTVSVVSFSIDEVGGGQFTPNSSTFSSREAPSNNSKTDEHLTNPKTPQSRLNRADASIANNHLNSSSHTALTTTAAHVWVTPPCNDGELIFDDEDRYSVYESDMESGEWSAAEEEQ